MCELVLLRNAIFRSAIHMPHGRGLRISSAPPPLHQCYHTGVFKGDIYMLCILSASKLRAESVHISAAPSDVMSYGTIGMVISYSPKKNKKEV